MRSPPRERGTEHRWARSAAVLVLAFAAILVLFDTARLVGKPIVGLPDNGDFWRVMKPAGIHYIGPLPSQKFVVSEFETTTVPARHLSSPALIAWAARAIPVGTRAPNRLDLRQVGAANCVLLALAVALLFGAPLEARIVGLLLLWVLSDPGYLLHFNSFFADAAAFIGAFAVAAWLVRSDRLPSPVARALLAATLVFFSAIAAFAKESYAPIGSIAALAVAGVVLRSFRADRSAWVLVSALAVVALLAPAYFSWGGGYRAEDDNRYNSVFMGIAVASNDRAATLRALGIPPDKTDLVGKSLFEVDETQVAATRHLSFLRVSLEYLEEPHALGVAIRDVASVLSWPRTTTVRNYTADEDPNKRWIRPSVLQFGWLRRRLLREPWQLWAWLCITVGWIGARVARRRIDALTVLVLYLLALFATQIVVAVIGDGLRTLNRHLLVARLALDWCVVIVLFALVRWLIGRAARRFRPSAADGEPFE